jgi:hypothetical protein
LFRKLLHQLPQLDKAAHLQQMIHGCRKIPNAHTGINGQVAVKASRRRDHIPTNANLSLDSQKGIRTGLHHAAIIAIIDGSPTAVQLLYIRLNVHGLGIVI